MNFVINRLANSWLSRQDLDYHILRASMVVIFLFFGYQKWFEYEAKVLIPYISQGPMILWRYPVFGIRGASWFLGVSEWLFEKLLFIGFWNKKLGGLGALGSIATFVGTVTIIPFMPNGWGSVGRRVPCDGWQRSISHEGRRVARRLHLFAERRCGEGARPSDAGGER